VQLDRQVQLERQVRLEEPSKASQRLLQSGFTTWFTAWPRN
jgi:hypothetical protein